MASRHILHLADGDHARRLALARLLRARGFEVLEFSRGSELFERALAAPPDLIVLTLDLDVMDGFQVVEWLRRRRPETHGRVVFLADSPDPVLAQACTVRGALVCLDGATPIDSLAAAIEAAFLRGSPTVRPEADDGALPGPIAAAPAVSPAVTPSLATPATPTARLTAAPSEAWQASAATGGTSRSARERAAIAALRESWHARDVSTETPDAQTPNGARPTRIPVLAVLALLFSAGFTLAVLRSSDLPALVARLGRLRADASERAVQAVRAPVRASRAVTEALDLPAEAADGAGLAASSEDAARVGRVATAPDPPAPPGVAARDGDGEAAGGPARPAAAEILTSRPAPAPEASPAIEPVAVQPVTADRSAAAGPPAPSSRAPDYSLTAIRDRPQFVYVDVPASLRAPLRPSYPRALAERKIGGAVTLWVLVSERGRVEDVRVLRSSGHPELDREALIALRLAAYAPARRAGVPVPTWTRQQVAFRLD